MSIPVADDSSEIWPRLMRLRRICFTKIGLPSLDCWCHGAVLNSDGTISDAPCTDAREPTAFDLLGKPSGEKTPEAISDPSSKLNSGVGFYCQESIIDPRTAKCIVCNAVVFYPAHSQVATIVCQRNEGRW